MKRVALVALAVLAASCATAPPPPPAPPPPKPLLGRHGFDLASIDRSVGACDDVYQYAVGGWR